MREKKERKVVRGFWQKNYSNSDKYKRVLDVDQHSERPRILGVETNYPRGPGDVWKKNGDTKMKMATEGLAWTLKKRE